MILPYRRRSLKESHALPIELARQANCRLFCGGKKHKYKGLTGLPATPYSLFPHQRQIDTRAETQLQPLISHSYSICLHMAPRAR